MEHSGSAMLRVDPASLDHEQRLDLLEQLQRLRAQVDARMTATLAAVHADPPPRPSRSESHRRQWAREEVAVRLRWSHGTTGNRLADAARLSRYLPATLSGLDAGRYTLRHAEVLLHGLRQLLDTLCHPPAALHGDSAAAAAARDADHRRECAHALAVIRAVETRVLPKAPQQTVAQFARTVARAVAVLDPVDAGERHEQARRSRFLTIDPAADGMAWLSAYLPAADAAVVATALDAVADGPDVPGSPDADGRGSRRPGRATRWADALREVCAAALAGRLTDRLGPLPDRGGHRPAVQVTVALSTLLRLDEAPGELAGYGAVPAEVAREIAFDATGTWRRLLTDDRGRLLDIGRTTYRPPTAVRALVTARDRTCTFPGCARPAQYCDADHLTPWAAGGTTDPANLHALCPRHHHARHDAGWHPERDPVTGVTTWTTPTGDSVTVGPRLLPDDSTWRSLAPPGRHRPRFARLTWRTDIVTPRRSVGLPDDAPPQPPHRVRVSHRAAGPAPVVPRSSVARPPVHEPAPRREDDVPPPF